MRAPSGEGEPGSPLDFLFLHGAPGAGKSSVAQAVHARLGTPVFEFGWIPEFRHRRHGDLTYAQEEAFSFENLALVLKNYRRRGFDRIVVTDLRDPIVRRVPRVFARTNWRLLTLTLADEALLKARVLDETRSSGYRDWEEALALNRLYRTRPLLPREVRLDVAELPVDAVAERVVALLEGDDRFTVPPARSG